MKIIYNIKVISPFSQSEFSKNTFVSHHLRSVNRTWFVQLSSIFWMFFKTLLENWASWSVQNVHFWVEIIFPGEKTFQPESEI